MRRTLPLILLVGLAFAAGCGAVLAAGDRLELETRAPTLGAAGTPDSAVVARARVIMDDDLADAAVAVFDRVAPRIHLNGRLLRELGPALSTFLLAHERGHLAHHHARRHGFGFTAIPTPSSTLRGYEFVADCYAVRSLQRGRPDAVVAAVRFFQLRRGLVTDAEHPPMGERADSLIACLSATAQ
ncbi:MAG: hypothetical protein H0T44_13290 [Gemmatimonadales bacterium]|nr:hypothetical protein [Gemmatimonadales bacterium]